MKVFASISRILLGLMFLVFGLNGFIHFIPMPPPTGLAGQYMGALVVSHYLSVVFVFQLTTAVLLLANRFVPLAIAILAPVLVNIVLFHALLAPHGVGPAILAVALWLVLFFCHRTAFRPLFVAKSSI
jgi:putative oxidoreductase